MKKLHKQFLFTLLFAFSLVTVSLSKLKTEVTSKEAVVSGHTDFSMLFIFKGIGALFAANAASTTTSAAATANANDTTIGCYINTFAITTALSILNFQIGGGYKSGALSPLQSRGVLSTAYAIPLSTLMKGDFLVDKNQTNR